MKAQQPPKASKQVVSVGLIVWAQFQHKRIIILVHSTAECCAFLDIYSEPVLCGALPSPVTKYFYITGLEKCRH